MTAFKRLTIWLHVVLAGAPWSARAQQPVTLPPPPPASRAALRLHVSYPAPGSTVASTDSIFVYGSTGTSGAVVTVNGQPAHVASNGAWLAWVALPRDSAPVLAVRARRGGDSATAQVSVARAGWLRETGAWIDRTSASPVGSIWVPREEAVALSVRAAPDAAVRLIMADGTVVQLTADSLATPVPTGIRDFDRDDRNLRTRARGDRYVGVLPAGAGGRVGDLELGAGTAGNAAVLEVSRGGLVRRMAWPISVTRTTAPARSVVLDDDPEHRGGTDRLSIGRALPGGTYSWFFPQGTRARADARVNGLVRLRLASDAIAWVPVADVHLASAADDPRPAVMGSLTMTSSNGMVRLRIPLTRAVPSSVDEDAQSVTITLWGAVSDANFTRYGAGQDFVELLSWKQDAADRVVLSVRFRRMLWGWRSQVEGNDLVFEFRAPPTRDPARPLAGRLIVVDPGHPPDGACGPTNYCEPEVNLAVARLVRDALMAGGARVVMTRASDVPVELWPRVALADSIGADLLISIHHNALPDGVNPFTNNGTSTFFNHPNSIGLARAVQARLQVTLGLRDLGVARGDFALVRATWYPAILTEGLHLMVPEQEALMRTVAGQRRYAAGIVEGITAFLRNSTTPRPLRRQ